MYTWINTTDPEKWRKYRDHTLTGTLIRSGGGIRILTPDKTDDDVYTCDYRLLIPTFKQGNFDISFNLSSVEGDGLCYVYVPGMPAALYLQHNAIWMGSTIIYDEDDPFINPDVKVSIIDGLVTMLVNRYEYVINSSVQFLAPFMFGFQSREIGQSGVLSNLVIKSSIPWPEPASYICFSDYAVYDVKRDIIRAVREVYL